MDQGIARQSLEDQRLNFGDSRRIDALPRLHFMQIAYDESMSVIKNLT
ncbi:MAG: hypothetical protein LBR82_02105 [Desulfovibrio sp.]|nr:hypothetical protein [Desulfovibrio sp.]